MKAGMRTVLVRVVALVGLGASAALTADAIRPGARAFCPLEQACAAARSSALGSLFGIPTSILGMIAFSGLLLLSFWPGAGRWFLLRSAGILGAVAGLGLLAYQALVLGTICPLCLVADLSGIAAGAVLWGWRASDGGARARDGKRTRIAWAVTWLLVAAVPLLWPHAARPAWVPIATTSEGGAAAKPSEPSAPPAIPLVEYLNPFCAHCRATHGRLARVLSDLAPNVRRSRLYVWSGRGAPPLWAQMCVCAQDQGDLKERAFFRELMTARDESRRELLAAAARAELDIPALESCVESGAPLARLENLRRIVQAAHIEGLPTIDLGRRRLEGEQSEEDLREAVQAAVADLAAGTIR